MAHQNAVPNMGGRDNVTSRVKETCHWPNLIFNPAKVLAIKKRSSGITEACGSDCWSGIMPTHVTNAGQTSFTACTIPGVFSKITTATMV
jgi:hypothetical protein